MGCGEVVHSVMKCIYAPRKMILCINLMEFGTNSWSMKSHLLHTTVHCCGVSEACVFASPSSIISFCMWPMSFSFNICQILTFFSYVIVPVCG